MSGGSNSLWVVTRQRYWADGRQVVEIAQGGRDYSNADALCKRYEGEFEEYEDPRKAVEVAVGILREWRRDLRGNKPLKEDDKRGSWPHLAVGCTMGFGMNFEDISIRDAETWAQEAYDRLPKYDACGTVVGREQATLVDRPDLMFCCPSCAERALAREMEK